jgi:outer membrane biogenesis lipoprotein LolB
MKKLLLLVIAIFLLTSCNVEVSEKFLMKNYDETNKVLNLSGNKFEKLPEFSKYLT